MTSNDSAATDVFVVGGGPAGLAAAIAARQRGFEVVVADVFRPPIDKACGEGLMPDSVAALSELGVDLTGLDSGVFRGIRFIGEEGAVDGEFPRGCGQGIRRTLLHEVLVERARKLGVNLLWGVRVSAVRTGAVLVDGRAVRCRWIIGADGQNSQVRRWAGLNAGHEYERRIGMRRHFRMRPWSDYVEIYWGADFQAYTTPISKNEICVALIARAAVGDFAAAIQQLPALARNLGSAMASSEVRGAVTVTRTLRRVARNNFALIGEASGSTDAITGEGLAMSFRQALALAEALAAGDLSKYEAAHRQIRKLPHFMGRTMLLMDKSGWIRDHALRALSGKPSLFRRMLALHVGELTLAKFGLPGFVDLGWQILTA